MSWTDRASKIALGVGVLGLGLGAAGFAMAGKEQFFRSYLLGFTYWFGIAFGCLGVQMIHALTGGRWGMAARRTLLAVNMTLPLLALLFIPLIIGAQDLYPWAFPGAAERDQLIQYKQGYLNVPFFAARALLFFGLWSGLAYLLRKRAVRAGIDKTPTRTLRRLAGPGLLACALTMTVASVDWLMSLDPHWFSTMFAVLVVGGQLLSAVAFVVLLMLLDARKRNREVPKDVLNDYGNLLFLFVMLWAYFSFSQYLIIYSGNIAEDTAWYFYRSQGGWQALALLLIGLHFAVPLIVLLSRRSKRNPTILALVATAILVTRLVEYHWFIAPNFHHDGIAAHPLDLALPVGIGGVWLFWFLRQLGHKELAAAG